MNKTNKQYTLKDLFRSLDERKAPEQVAAMIVSAASEALPNDIVKLLGKIKREYYYSSMTSDFNRSAANLDKQLRISGQLFGVQSNDAETQAVLRYLAEVEAKIGKAVGKNDFKHDRLNSQQREEVGGALANMSRRQYNKRFRLAARLEDKLNRRERETAKRGLTLASKSRLASKLKWEQFSQDIATACFIAYYTARCNLRSMFTINSQVRAFDEICQAMMQELEKSKTTNWFAIAYVMPDEKILQKLPNVQKGWLLGCYYEMLLSAGKFLEEVWQESDIDKETMCVKRGNDSSTWNLMAGAWNKLRDGWFNLCHSMKMDQIVDTLCFGKVMRLMAADVMRWHESAGSKKHDDTSVWNVLPLPWEVMAGKEKCTRKDVEYVCNNFDIDPYKQGWIARRGEKKVEQFTPTPELVHGVVISSPFMAQAMKKAGIFSGKELKGTEVINFDAVLDAKYNHYETVMNKFGA